MTRQDRRANLAAMSVFLERPASEHVARNALAFAIRDGFPVSPGHTLVVPFREVATWFDATREEQMAMLELVDAVKAQLDAERAPAGYNVGFNAGAAAGQTVMHLHVHVIPRYEGDVPDPRGGVRHVMPGRGNYLAASFAPATDPGPRGDALTTGGKHDGFLRALGPALRGATALDVVAAFVQQSGLRALEDALKAMAPGATLRLLTGDYLGITQADALRSLLDWQAGLSPVASHAGPDAPPAAVAVRVVETAALPTASRSFHPKAWLVEHGPQRAVAWVGSSNLSMAALTDGVEWNLRLDRAADLPGWLRLRLIAVIVQFRSIIQICHRSVGTRHPFASKRPRHTKRAFPGFGRHTDKKTSPVVSGGPLQKRNHWHNFSHRCPEPSRR